MTEDSENAGGGPRDEHSRALTEPESGSSSAPSSDSLDGARFVPGTLLAERYRIVGLLGRGGMGEVYRAEDLKLGEPVALKFLPTELSLDGAALARFHREVRVARNIAHRNVCRVFDIGEADGLHFLSMEYIDGEDLSSLLKRIGRLPGDKAVELARQICAGLGAAHEAGVLHRDIKPANVMIDGKGRAKITDFGLAQVADDLKDQGAFAGTPAYMAPEQIKAGEVSVKTDIYALGLVLYEMFTGKRALRDEDWRQLAAGAARRDVSRPSSHIEGLDPVVEAVILRCLEAEPSARPSSALEVSAALPGGDPLAAALAAGETPSPEMVAAASEKGTLRPAVALGCFVALLALLATWVKLIEPHDLTVLARLEKSPEVLADRAATVVERLGSVGERPYRQSSWLGRESYMRHLREDETAPDRGKAFGPGRPAEVTFWHRQSPAPLYREDLDWRPAPRKPPLGVPGEVRVELDPQGRLVGWWAVPWTPAADAESPKISPPQVDWTAFFAEAGLDPAAFHPGEPHWAPLLPSDRRLAWEGATNEVPEVRIEAASFDGRPVYFAVVEPWDEPLGDRLTAIPAPPGRSVELFYILPLTLLIVFAGTWLARRHLRSGRGDRRGTLRLGLFAFFSNLAAWLLGAHHAASMGELALFFEALSSSLFYAAFLCVAYLALEPFLRRHWPEGLISWTRLLAGNFRDPLVGRDVLIGLLLGTFIALVGYVDIFFADRFNYSLANVTWEHLIAPRFAAAHFFEFHTLTPIRDSLGLTLVFLLIYLVTRRKWIAWLVLVCIIPGGPLYGLSWGSSMAASVLALAVVRFGLLSTMGVIFTAFVLWEFPMTTDLTAWYAERTVFALGLIAALGFYGLRVSLAGRPILGSTHLRD